MMTCVFPARPDVGSQSVLVEVWSKGTSYLAHPWGKKAARVTGQLERMHFFWSVKEHKLVISRKKDGQAAAIHLC